MDKFYLFLQILSSSKMAFDDDDDDSLCLPLLKKWGKAHENISEWIWKCWKPLKVFSNWLVFH